MKAQGPKIERETVINYNEIEKNATIWTSSMPTYRKLLKLGHIPREDRERSAIFEIPIKCVSFRRVRVRRVLTEEERGRISKRLHRR